MTSKVKVFDLGKRNRSFCNVASILAVDLMQHQGSSQVIASILGKDCSF